MGVAWVRKYYGVPAKRGGRVKYTGKGCSELGTIAGARGAHWSIRLDGWKVALPFHTTWKLRYLTSQEAMQARGGAN